MTTPDAPRERQTLRLPPARLAAFRPWATEGTATTAAARVRRPDGAVALVRNAWSDGWLPPGGAVEADERPRAAAAREVREETGLDAAVGDPLVVVEQTYVDRRTDAVAFDAEYVLYAARAEGSIPDAEQLGVDADEIRAARWFRTLPEDLHDDALLRPYLRGDG